VSIWSSIDGADVTAVNQDDDWPANQYRATTEPSLSIDVATAKSWNGNVRLSIVDLATLGHHVDLTALLTIEDAERLRDYLDRAIIDIRTPFPPLDLKSGTS
jgi:hypothetical protein